MPRNTEALGRYVKAREAAAKVRRDNMRASIAAALDLHYDPNSGKAYTSRAQVGSLLGQLYRTV